MQDVRRQFLGIVSPEKSLKAELTNNFEHLANLQTGGNTFCYAMLYNFDIDKNIAKDFCLIRNGQYPLFDVRLRIIDMKTQKEIFNHTWGEISAHAECIHPVWPLSEKNYYRIFFHARNGQYIQDLQLKKSISKKYWAAATQVKSIDGNSVVFEYVEPTFIEESGPPIWK